MQNNRLLKKGLAFSIVVLFVGISITPKVGSVIIKNVSTDSSNGTTIKDNCIERKKETQVRSNGLAPQTNRPSILLNAEKSQPTLPGGRDYFYAFNAYDPNGMQDGPVTFDSDAVVNLIAPHPEWDFISGSDFDPWGNWYAVLYSGGLLSVNKNTGDMTEIAPISPCDSLVYDSSTGIWYVSSSNSLDTIEITTGAMNLVGSFGISNYMISLMCDTDGNMYGYDAAWGANSSLYSIDKFTGAATPIGGMGHDFYYAQEGKFDRNDGTLYLAAYDIDLGQSYLATCDPSTAAVTIINQFNPTGIEIDGFSVPYSLVHYDHDVGVSKIKAPVSGNASVITPVVTVKNYGNDDETNVPVECTIAKKHYDTILTQDFEGSFPPSGWAVQTISGGSWHRNDYWTSPRPNQAGAGYCADADANKESNAPMLTLLTSPVMDLSTVSNATLDFNSYEYVDYYDSLLIDASTDGGVSWTNIYKVTYSYEYGTYHHIQKDISKYCRNSSVQLRFGYFAPSFDSYWEVDDILVRTYQYDAEYNQYAYANVQSGMKTNVTFTPWTPADLGVSENVNVEYVVNATTQLSTDNNTYNDYKQKTFNLHYVYYNDVAVTGIPSPKSGLATTQAPVVNVSNNGQNNENISVNMVIGKATYNILLQEDFSGGVPPIGWGTDDAAHWMSSSTNYAGGTAPEAAYNWYPSETGDFHLYTCVIDTTGWTSTLLKYKEYVNDYNGLYTLKIQTSTDGGATWNDAYTRPGGAYGPTTTQVTLGTANGVGSNNLMISWTYSGDSYNINYWYIDDVWFGQVNVTTEYNQTVLTSIAAGQAMNVTLPDWTPAEIPFAMDIDYLVDVSVSMNVSDENPADNSLTKLIALGFEHDVGVTEISIEPYEPGYPGTFYPVGIVKNFGVTFSENNIPVIATITHIDNSTVIYNQNITALGPLAPGETAQVIFPDFTIFNTSEWSGSYRVEIKTILPGDDHPENDKKTLTFHIPPPPPPPPETTASLSGIMGLNGWYVSVVTVFLSVNAEYCQTYYKIDDGAWIEYFVPFVVSEDGYHIVYFHSVDMGGWEDIKNISFKIDQTLPTINLTKQRIDLQDVKFTAQVNDNTSGIDRVEFFLDGVLESNDTQSPYEWTWTGSGDHRVTATAFDRAGNSKSQSMSTPLVQSQSIAGLQISQQQMNIILSKQQ